MNLDTRVGQAEQMTLAIDIGGSHLKAAILDESGAMSSGPVRVKTPRPATPARIVAALMRVSQRLGQFDRVSIGFPGVVRTNLILTAPNLGTKAWRDFRLGRSWPGISASRYACSTTLTSKASE